MKTKLTIIIFFLVVTNSYSQDTIKINSLIRSIEESLELARSAKKVNGVTLFVSKGETINNATSVEKDTAKSIGSEIAFQGTFAADEEKNDTLQSIPEISSLTVQLSSLISELKTTMNQSKPVVTPTASSSSIKVGVLAQFQGQALQEQTSAVQDAIPNHTQHWQRQLMIRRLRILVGGNVTSATSIFFESDAVNIGKITPNGTKSPAVSMFVQDAQIQHMFMPELSLIAGLQLVGISRPALQSASSLMGINYGAYQFLASGPLDNSAGRDLGINARGLLMDERLEYRLGVFSGKNVNLYSPLRVSARFNYDFFDREKGFFYAGTTLGTGNILAVGGGVDVQGSYSAISLDGFYDAQLSSLGSITLTAGFTALDGGGSDQDSTAFTGLIPKQQIVFIEAGYFFKEYNLQPHLRYEGQNVNAVVMKQVNATPQTLSLQNTLRSGSRFGIGVNYFVKGHTANIKALYEVVTRNRPAIDPTNVEKISHGEFTLQVQYFFY